MVSVRCYLVGIAKLCLTLLLSLIVTFSAHWWWLSLPSPLGDAYHVFVGIESVLRRRCSNVTLFKNQSNKLHAALRDTDGYHEAWTRRLVEGAPVILEELRAYHSEIPEATFMLPQANSKLKYSRLSLQANVCEPWCRAARCKELNGDIERECGGCKAGTSCWPGADDYSRGLLNDASPLDEGQSSSALNASAPLWRTAWLRIYGKDTEVARHFPRTMALLAQTPIITSQFSVMEPGKELDWHRGPYAGVLRHLLHLDVPQGCDNVLEIQPTPRSEAHAIIYEQGADIIFDDSILHRVKNSCNQTRISLFSDFLRPDLPLHTRLLNRIVVGALTLSETRSQKVDDVRRYHREGEAKWRGSHKVEEAGGLSSRSIEQVVRTDLGHSMRAYREEYAAQMKEEV